MITVHKGSLIIHRAQGDEANTLEYHEGLRSNLYDLMNGEKRELDLFKVWKQKLNTLQSDIIDEAKRCR